MDTMNVWINMYDSHEYDMIWHLIVLRPTGFAIRGVVLLPRVKIDNPGHELQLTASIRRNMILYKVEMQMGLEV